MDLSDARTGEFLVFGRRVARVLGTVFRTTVFDWTIQEGQDAGQTVPHLHMHVIPRLPADFPNPGDWYRELRQAETDLIDSRARPRLTPRELGSIVQRIRRIAGTRGAALARRPRAKR